MESHWQHFGNKKLDSRYSSDNRNNINTTVNNTFRELATKYFLLNTINLNKMILTELIHKGQVKDYDPDLLAFEFTAPVTTLVALTDREPDKEEMAMNIIRNHMEHFVKVYGA